MVTLFAEIITVQLMCFPCGVAAVCR